MNSEICVLQNKLLALLGILVSLSWPVEHLAAQAAAAVRAEPLAGAETPDSEPEPVNDAMETEGLDPKLARVLTRYYKKTFSSLENWEEVQSVIFKGILHLPQGEIDFAAHKKKPDLYKVVLHPRQGDRVVMAYDGNEAWQLNMTRANSVPGKMPEGEAKNFIRDASIGGHLLHPLMKGKQIEMNGFVKVNGRDCFQLEVTLPDGQRIRSAIDIVTYEELRRATTNNVNGEEEIYFYSDFRVVEGVRFPFTSVMKSDGKETLRVELSEVRVNAGLMKSMFQPPSAISPLELESETTKQKLSIQPSTNAAPVVPFGESRFGESLFADPQEGDNAPAFNNNQ